MATPAITARNATAQIVPGQAGKLRILTLDADGAELDVSSGYAEAFFNVVPASNANPDKAATDIKGNMSFAFDATGVDITWTAAQASTIAAALSTLSSAFGFGISNDSGTTASLAAVGTLLLNRDKQLQS